MGENIENILSNDAAISSFADGLIELEKYMAEKKPDVCLVPLRGAFPIRFFLEYIQEKSGHDKLPFRYTMLSADRIDGSIYNSLYVLSKSSGPKFEKIMLTDEVIDGGCWNSLFSPYLNNVFKNLNSLGAKTLMLAGLGTKNGREGQQAIKKILSSTFNLYFRYECPIVRELIDSVSTINKGADFIFLVPPQAINKSIDLGSKIRNLTDYKRNVEEISSSIAEHCLMLEHSVENDPFCPSSLPKETVKVMELLDNYLGNNGLKVISDKIIALKEKKPELFAVKETGCEFEFKIINCEIPFIDKSMIIGLEKDKGIKGKVGVRMEILKESGKDLYEHIKLIGDESYLCFKCQNNDSERFYELVRQKIDQKLGSEKLLYKNDA